ncbi:MAG TPA: glycosyltransferase family 1 protein [Patescibacteria group bacterium]|nr:glycosyltransferase family 1 protein [Patescibacteria group bacterium]
MRVGIDVSQVVYGTGVSVYTKNLVENLLRLDHNNEYVLFAGSLRRKADILSLLPTTKVFPIPPMLADVIWNRLHMFPIEKFIGNIDVFHSSDWSEPPSSAFKVTTIHDLYPIKFPKLINGVVRDVHKRRLSWVFQESKRIIVPSNSTKNDLLEIGLSENLIRVIPEAPTLTRPNDSLIDSVKSKYGIVGDYLISIGATRLKNTKAIVKSFHLARPGKDLKLIVVGRPSGIEFPVERNVRFLGHVDSNDLAALLSGSSGLLFASLYEGFGIPILDAFNCSVPVVTSNISSMSEVAGNAAILVDPTSIESITEGIEKVIRGPKAYIDKGLRRVKDFSWEKTAKMTLDVYREASIADKEAQQ